MPPIWSSLVKLSLKRRLVNILQVFTLLVSVIVVRNKCALMQGKCQPTFDIIIYLMLKGKGCSSTTNFLNTQDVLTRFADAFY